MSCKVICLDTNKAYSFTGKTPYEAMVAMRYFLNLSMVDSSADIHKTESGKHLYMEHNGMTYAVRM